MNVHSWINKNVNGNKMEKLTRIFILLFAIVITLSVGLALFRLAWGIATLIICGIVGFGIYKIASYFLRK